MNSYKFGGGDERKVFSVLAEGDYEFKISDYTSPYQKDNGRWVLRIELEIKGQRIFDQVWSGETDAGETRDQIGELLLCVNRAPKLGEEPDWRRIVGAHGKCRLKVETAQMGALAGKEVNRVAYYYRPKEIGPTAEPPRQSYSPEEVAQASKTAQAAASGGGGDIEPDDIPF